MIKVKKINGRWRWLNPEKHDFVYFTDKAVEKLLTIISPIEEGKIYDVSEEGVFYLMNHSPLCNGISPNTECYECGGQGILADTFSR